MNVGDLKRKLENLKDDMPITWEFFGVRQVANAVGPFTKKVQTGTYYKWDNCPEPLFIIDRDVNELVVYLYKTGRED